MKMKEMLKKVENGECTPEQFEQALTNRAKEKGNERHVLVMKMARTRTSLGD